MSRICLCVGRIHGKGQVMLGVERLSRTIGTKAILTDIRFTLAPGHKLAVVGPSGSGKTTLLRCLAGLEAPSAGKITWLGQDLSVDGKVRVEPETRRFGVVFQDSSLFPHLSVSDNVAFGLADKAQLGTWLEEFQLAPLKSRSVLKLSGGERQRVALARAMSFEPQVLLLDEPFSNIDRLARHHLITVMKTALAKRQIPVVLITHDARDAVDLGCDQLLLMNGGKQVTCGPLATVVKDPGDTWAREFLECCLSLPLEARA